MVIGFKTTNAISAYHHEHCEFESCSGEVHSIQHYMTKFVSSFSPGTPVSSTNKTDHHNITVQNIVESGIKHYNPNANPNLTQNIVESGTKH